MNPTKTALNVRLRVAHAADAEALALVGRATFLESYAGVLGARDILAHCATQHAPQAYGRWLQDAGSCCWLVEAAEGAAPVGYLVLAPADLPVADPVPDDLEIKRIYLLHRFQGGGAGRQMMRAALDEARRRRARRVLLGVYSGNHAALGFYSHVGFRRVGERTFRVGQTDYFDYVLGMDL